MSSRAARRALRGAVPLLLIAAAVPASSSAQATRTWVSGVGDDANPCSRTAPCKTWAGAISKTAAGGEIDALDDGGFGAANISKSITLDGGRHLAGILAAGTNGVIMSGPGPGLIRVTLRNLQINGAGTGTNGVRVLNNVDMVRIENTEIFGFTQSGVDLSIGNGVSRRVQIRKSSIYDNVGSIVGGANGIWLRPSGGVGVTAKLTVTNSDVSDNGNNIVIDGTNAKAHAVLRNNDIDDAGNGGGTGRGVQVIGANGLVRLDGNQVTGNVFGLVSTSGGIFESFRNNDLSGNDNPNAATTPVNFG